MRTFSSNALLLAASLAVLTASGCRSAEKPLTTAEWLEENTSILQQLRSYDRKERQEGINRFLKLAEDQGPDQGVAVVHHLLADPKLDDYRAEVVLARILADWKDRRAIPHLLRAIEHRDRGAVEIAKEGLLVFRDEREVLEAMQELLEKPEVSSREVAAAILVESSTPRASELLGAHFSNEESIEIRRLCIVGVIEGKSPQRKAVLVEALADPDLEIRAAAWEALESAKPPVEFDPDTAPEDQERALRSLRKWADAKGR